MSYISDDLHRRKRSRFSVELPTLVLTCTIYLSWFILTFYWTTFPFIVLFVLGGWTIAWHGSLQHEVLHGHPTRFRRINDAIGWPPVSLWLPYTLYKHAHLKHHNDEWLTDPIEDPESYYFTDDGWNKTGRIGQMIRRVNNTLAGRLTLGPLIAVAALWGSEAARFVRGDATHAAVWLRHLVGVAAIIFWVVVICQMPIWIYLVAFAYSGLAFSRLRSFAEHRYAGTKEERTAIVEKSPAFGLLFLYNNLHIVHHSLPQLPWYKIPGLYHAQRQAFIELNGGLVYNGYLDVARRYLFRQHHEPIHPQHMAGQTSVATEISYTDQLMTG
ncbi:fatty acid desaturase [Ciceribacter sp. L1K23]|uniref:fatty acid desaturase n=1 Tax=Ciceribacter sp. L1K23 TaxID=2820276 RepID=UPI001B83FA04|nr:fatty acid desaturase [Ciceribacter sp. L1K23]MBR0557272.1 fatty acid desaturase [Ciceribacter sp. L1K23]